jgi:hypothetical protein
MATDTALQEQIDLEHLINDAQDLTQTMQRRGIEMKADQLPISAIIRCPLLAIRWQLPNQKVRKAPALCRLDLQTYRFVDFRSASGQMRISIVSTLTYIILACLWQPLYRKTVAQLRVQTNREPAISLQYRQ